MSIRSQKMAQEAYPLVAKIANTDLEKAYRTLALNLPSMILQSGLIQTVGFLLAKSKGKSDKEHHTILQHLAELLKDNIEDNNLHETVLNADLAQYQLLTRQALDASSCLKRYTQALLKSD